MDNEPLKTCPKCNLPKPLSKFRKDKSKPDGRTARCRQCLREIGRLFNEQHGKERRQRSKAYMREYLRARYSKLKEEAATMGISTAALIRKNKKP